MGMAQPQRCDSIRPSMNQNAPLKRLYQVWGGSNRFLLGGRLVFGPDARSLILTVFLIVSPVVLFCVFISQRLIHEFRHHLGNVIVAIPAVFTAYIIVLLLLTSGRDPGIIPRNRRPPEPEDEGDSSGLSLDWAGNQSSVSSLPVTKEVIVNGMVVKVKYCQTCMLYRPPRCSHCSICNNCVDRFDHHCPWVGQCIGKRNYRFFFMFVSSTTILCIYVFAFCVINIMKIMEAYHCHLGKALGISPVSGILIIYTFIGAWFVGGLTFFHLYLICKNQTTYENFRYRYDGKRNPHNRGFFRNVGEIFFSKIPSSRVDFRAKVEDMPDILFSSVFSSSRSLGRSMSHKTPKRTVDLEIGDKRQAIGAEELDNILKRLDSVAGLERCGTQPLRANLGYKGNWEISSEVSGIQMLAT